jgi:hypothetical protein
LRLALFFSILFFFVNALRCWTTLPFSKRYKMSCFVL